jgi:mRNA (2'-O-methyladenosine-N6-)-methyltransferase
MDSGKRNKTANNADIRTFFSSNNKRIMKVIEPYLKEIDENNYKLRERKIIDYKAKFQPSDSEGDGIDEGVYSEQEKPKKKINKKLNKKRRRDSDEEILNEESENESDSDESSVDDIANNSDAEYLELRESKCHSKLKTESLHTIYQAEQEIKKLEKEFYLYEGKISENKSKYPDMSIPICTDIREFKFKNLAQKQKELTGQLFDVIMMDPPWQLSSSQPTRGVAIAYDTLSDSIITDIPIEELQTDGFIFIWTINAKFKVTLDLIKGWGYR